MRPIYVIFNPHTTGGAGTLSMRLGKWLTTNGYETVFICNEITDSNNYADIENSGIRAYCWEKSKISGKLLEKYMDGEKFVFLTYNLSAFIFVERLRKHLDIEHSLLYNISNTAMKYGKSNIFKLFFKKIFLKLDENNSLIYPSNKPIEINEKFYKISIHNKEDKLIRLPIETSKFDYEAILKKTKTDSFKVISIARSKFPFKGYLFGLIDDYNKISKKYKNIKLTIVTFGEDFDKLKDYIDKLEDNVKCNINLIGQTSYNDLKQLIKASHVNVGMGTTLLDAGIVSVPSIIAKDYTYDNSSSGFFHMNPKRLSATNEEMSTFYTYLNEIISLSEEEYIKVCKETNEVVKDLYDINNVMKKLIKIRPNKKGQILSNTELFIYKLRYESTTVFKRIIKDFR